jgi:hypothetical protein
MTQPKASMIIHDFSVRNFTDENLEQEELSCLVQFLSSLDVCKSCIAEIPKIESSFGSNLDFQIDFESRTLEIHYGKRSFCGW